MDALADAPRRDAARESTNWPRVAFGVALGAYAAYQQFKLPPILPDFLARYPHSPFVAAGFMSVYALVSLGASAALGRKLDRNMGLGIAALIGPTVIGITLALIAPQSAALMPLSRGLEGLAFAIAIAGPAIAAAVAKPRDLPVVTGLLAAWIPLGQIAAALAALALHEWRALWLSGLIMGLSLGLWAWALLGEARNSQAAAGASFFGIVMSGRNIGVFIGPLLVAFLIGADSYALHLSWTAAARSPA